MGPALPSADRVPPVGCGLHHLSISESLEDAWQLRRWDGSFTAFVPGLGGTPHLEPALGLAPRLLVNHTGANLTGTEYLVMVPGSPTSSRRS